MIFAAIALILVVLVVASTYLSGKAGSDAKIGKVSLLASDQEVFLDIKRILDAEGIGYSSFLWSPSQLAYNEPGTAQRSPKILWFAKEDESRLLNILRVNRVIERTENGYVVKNSPDASKPVE